MRTKSKLPGGWDKRRFNTKLSYEKRVRYATDRATKIGSGSSRSVFEIREGRKRTALKIAVTRAGVAQNRIETNPTIHSRYNRILVPLIGYDKNSRSPIWAQFEKVKPLKKSIFKKVTGFYFSQFVDAVYYAVKKTRRRTSISGHTPLKTVERILSSNSKFFKLIVDMTLEFKLEPIDWRKESNWGIYKGRPVLIDFGYTEKVAKKFYYEFCL